MTEIARFIAEVIATKQRLESQRRGLDQTDHSMFNRALTRYQQTEIEIAEFRRKYPVGTSDPRANPDWRPTLESIKKISREKKVDNQVRSSEQGSAIDSLFGKLSGQ